MKIVIFTDLDGSLLHSKTYSFEEAMPALEVIRQESIPLVLCSSKTRAEIEVYRKRLDNRDPFIVENGGALFVPAGYFPFPTGSAQRDKYSISAFGRPYAEIRKEFTNLRDSLHIPVKGFGDMTAEEIAAWTGLPREEASLAGRREFGEPFFFTQGADERFLKAVEDKGLHWTQGKLYFLMGDHSKGTAVHLLKQWYEGAQGTVITIGLGDGLNDLPLLREVDHPVLIRREDGKFDPRINVPGLYRTEGIGPAGWNEAVLKLLKRNQQ